MNIRQAILSAANSIEQYPKLFDFNSTIIPNDCDTPGCALGWVAYHLGSKYLVSAGITWKSDSFTGDDGLFYKNMNHICGSDAWKTSASECSSSLRIYADKYHPTQGIPDSVLAISKQNAHAL